MPGCTSPNENDDGETCSPNRRSAIFVAGSRPQPGRRRTTPQNDLELFSSRQRLFGGDNDVGLPEHPAQMPLAEKPDGRNRSLHGGSARNQSTGQLRENVCLVCHK
jgi:hypothetical protein